MSHQEPEEASMLQLEKIRVAKKGSSYGHKQVADSPTSISAKAKQFLVISSPSEKKIVWTPLIALSSSEGRAFALVDSGLEEPRGIALDRKHGFLYVADIGVRKIFRYTLLAINNHDGSSPKLKTSGYRTTICEQPAEWLTIDDFGTLFYTDPETNNINKISADVLNGVGSGLVSPSSLQIVSEKEYLLQFQRDQVEEALYNASDLLPTDSPPIKPNIYSMYESALNPLVARPAGLLADGENLYWANQFHGKTVGTVVRGSVDPAVTNRSGVAEPFPATAVTNISNGAYSLALTNDTMFFSSNGTVTGILMDTDIALDFVTTLVKPRGLAWDRDQTIYVADEHYGKVWSFPAGVMMQNAPLLSTVKMKGAYGLAVVNTEDIGERIQT